MNTKIVKIVCPHKERMEIYFEEGAVLLPGEAGSSCYLAYSEKLSWLAPDSKAGQPLTEEERQEVLRLEPVLRTDRENPIVFLYDGELYSAASVLAEKHYDRKMPLWLARRKLKKAFPDVSKGIIGSVLGVALYNNK